MKNTLLKTMALASVLFVAIALGGCASDDSNNERLAALEAEVKALKANAQVREERFREELTQIRKNLEGIRGLIQVEKGRAGTLDAPKPDADSGEALDQEIDEKAKSFVSENLDRLLEITKKLLDKMEKELDAQMEQPAPEPEGDKI